MSTARGAHDRLLVAACVRCGATAGEWYERVGADSAAELRASVGTDGRPTLHALYDDACSVCGAPELEIRVEAVDDRARLRDS
jgi:hypothetical protein